MDSKELWHRIHHQQLYCCTDESIGQEQIKHLDLLFAYNQLPPSKQTEKQALLKDMFAEIGDDCYIETPFHANWGGKFAHFGHHIYANFNLTLVDDTTIYVGDYVQFGPNVVLAAGTHPIDPESRKKQAQYNLPIHIKDNVWIGANTVVLPGVTIGENSVIGAGSVVTKNLPANVVAVGNPCRVLREINEHDRTFYNQEKRIDI
ncbi:sugar O-acetyltransferase [Candidatus Enterococcus willemsii]|uniref:Acetyltransferase n=1 Tax=Candidatus Enterococcus willemsii TaxID=1857215 RepID=A0ABQ6YWI0_9ENTE|nr:sugar O-acetyltransferase [Enterococcus sp. CU12B]KAF1302061.1 galactoside O-acetyltransferase [Enterococcus sp. CU12B]